ncbi:MFS transporter [Alicyclobacillus tolerans]|uniref:EmrB/QacA subfamily drug resistance transporter n=1 Tax=Alicyclobacillus tolerans TaxID=90970 RepID=A0ABT9LV52_9BACL|nr:MFS transporter [Alicyclobacillus tengchongensis]MDP9728113.1 EmrB/QacA subfamily drug resistance transporter [Alicyclobacillus tengchongensis]
MKQVSEQTYQSWYRWIIFTVVVSGTFMVNVDSSIMNVALPVLEKDFHTTPQVLQWVISAYLLMITGILPIIGTLSDRLDRKTVFLTGIGIFTFGSLLCAFSESILQLIVFRIFQSIGGAIIMGNVMSIVSYIFPSGERGRPLGLVGSVVAAGTIVGPSLGGFLISSFGWRSVFLVNLPIGAISFIAIIFVLMSIRSNQAKNSFDVIGASLYFLAIICLLLFMSEGSTWGWDSLVSFVTITISIISFLFLIRREISIEHPIIQISLFRSSAFSIGNFTGYISYIMMMFPGILLPLYMHQVLHISESHIGFLLTPQAVCMILFSPIGGWLADKYGTHGPAMIGLLFATLGLGFMSMFYIHTSYLNIVIALSLFGIGIGLFTSPNNVAVLESAPLEKSGITGSLMATVRNFGRVSGVALSVLFLQLSGNHLYTTQGFIHATSFSFTMGFFIGILGILLTLIRLIIQRKLRAL